jgi:uncharacterized membrane protein YgdD (TMEM256/DUF423 family)
MKRNLKIIGAVFGMTAVIIGAFGAHGLEGKIDADSIKSFETGVKYQMYHALLLLILGFNLSSKIKFIKPMLYLFVAGIVFFSVSIYFLATNALTPFFDFTTIGFITPIGGTLLIVGWILLLLDFIKQR